MPSLEVVLNKVVWGIFWKVFRRSCGPPTRSVGPTDRSAGLLGTHVSQVPRKDTHQAAKEASQQGRFQAQEQIKTGRNTRSCTRRKLQAGSEVDFMWRHEPIRVPNVMLSLQNHHQNSRCTAIGEPKNTKRAMLCRGTTPPQAEVGHFPRTRRSTFVEHQRSQEGGAHLIGTRWEDEALEEEGVPAPPPLSSTMVATTEILECQCNGK
jgi:hypothetical protein